MKRMEPLRRLLFTGFVIALALALFGWLRPEAEGYGLLDLLRGDAPSSQSFTPAEGAELDIDDVPLLNRLDAEYSTLAEAVLPAVVSITTKTVRQGNYAWHPFYGVVAGRPQVIPGLGSGVIISSEGHVVTNYHVIEDVNEVMLMTHDNQKYPARILGASRQRDIAVLKIESKRTNFPALSFTDSDAVRVGQLVMAVGNPFGLSGTVTRGIISARDRHLSDSKLDYLQTDAVINPGNSGGPLVNVRGEILGINVAIYRGDENVRAWQGVGLAVPSKDVQAVVEAVLKREKLPLPPPSADEEVMPGFLGIEVAEESVLMDDGRGGRSIGILVTDVVPGSPAQKSGIQANDVIVAMDGETFASPVELLNQIRSLPAGKTVTVRIARDGSVLDLPAQLGARPS
jgi:S1-C subfamily serine protease